VVDVERARELAEEHLATPLPRRWRHVQGVAARASEVAARIGDGDGTLVSAAWLHDIGYGPVIAATGFHPLDGARYLMALGAPRRLVNLVAHHSYAVLESRLRGHASEMTAFDDERTAMRDALWYCDLTTSPHGTRVRADERMAEIKKRYGPGHVVTLRISPHFRECGRSHLAPKIGHRSQTPRQQLGPVSS
jgi:HD domain